MWDSSARGIGRYRYSDGSQRGPGAIVLSRLEEQSVLALQVSRGGDNNPGLQAQITFINFINSKSGFKPTSSPYQHPPPSLPPFSLSLAFSAMICSQLYLLGWIFYETNTRTARTLPTIPTHQLRSHFGVEILKAMHWYISCSYIMQRGGEREIIGSLKDDTLQRSIIVLCSKKEKSKK